MNMAVNRKGALFLLLIVMLLLTLAYISFASSAKNELASREQELNQKSKELEALKKNAQGGPEKSDKSKLDISQLRAMIPEKPDFEGLLREFRVMENVSKMQMSSYNFDTKSPVETSAAPKESAKDTSAPKAANNTSIVPLALPVQLTTSVKGTKSQVLTFLKEIETSKRIMAVTKISMKTEASPPVKINAWTQEFTCSLTIITYYAPSLQPYLKKAI